VYRERLLSHLERLEQMESMVCSARWGRADNELASDVVRDTRNYGFRNSVRAPLWFRLLGIADTQKHIGLTTKLKLQLYAARMWSELCSGPRRA
jgi:hypothetical protein